MDTQVVIAVIALASALGVAALAVIGGKQKYPADYMDDIRGDLASIKVELAAALVAANYALACKIEVENYARELEDRLDIPHRRWSDYNIPEGKP